MREITAITVHHTATSPGATVESMDRYHREELGWVAIAYHFLVDAGGELWIGRSTRLHPDSRTEADFTGHIFVAAVGNFEEELPPRAQLLTLSNLLLVLRDEYPEAKLGLHCDYVETACPGRHLVAMLGRQLDA